VNKAFVVVSARVIPIVALIKCMTLDGNKLWKRAKLNLLPKSLAQLAFVGSRFVLQRAKPT